MQRVLVIGSCGAGKSTFARQLSEVHDLPVIHLDQHYFGPNWEEPDKKTWAGRVRELVKADRWIIDGNYGSTMDMRIERADTIIMLDLSGWLCLWRILKRWLQYRGRVRPGSAPGCKEKMDWEFFHYVATFPFVRRPGLLKKLRQLPEHKQTIVLNSKGAVQAFLQQQKANML